MMRKRGEWNRRAVSLAILVSGVIGAAAFVSPGEVKAQGVGKQNPSATKEPDLTADLDAAIRSVEQNDFITFLDLYAPVDVLRRLRQQDLVERSAKVIASQPQTKRRLLVMLKALREQTPKYDKSRGLATLQFDPNAHGDDSVPGEIQLPNTDDLKLAGLGGDLKKVVEGASVLLAAGDLKKFVEQLFPASELARLKDPAAMQDLLQQIGGAANPPVNGGLSSGGGAGSFTAPTPKPAPARPGLNRPGAKPPSADSPTLLQALQADFKRLQTLTPELTDKGQVAVYKIESKDGQPVRVIKLQKVGGHWRLFDNSARVADELTRQAKLKPPAGVTTVHMERIGGNWRFIELPALGMGGR
jgi:hypothetical protein